MKIPLDFNDTPDVTLGFTKFIAGMIMHVSVNTDMMNALKMMKYASNHWWKFSNPRAAWLAGFL